MDLIPPRPDTVFIFGAGASFDAGIPLLGGFVDRMWDLAIRKHWKGAPLSASDVEIFKEAMNVRHELNEYHGRASFDDRNIEDILSILSFNEFLPTRNRKKDLAVFTRAIARTIELSCEVKHPGVQEQQNKVVESGSDLYRSFWHAYFRLVATRRAPPAIISFNYDLVLERSLLQVAIGKHFNPQDNPYPAPRLSLRYHHEGIERADFDFEYVTYRDNLRESRPGTILKRPGPKAHATRSIEIDLLKLHGSLNFPAARSESARQPFALTEVLEHPFILPPIFNKQSTQQQRGVWRTAMERLRGAKHVVIVGYSLPRTDIYMQYFLKAALGPNVNLSRIIVFDPALYAGKRAGDEMMSRYSECFAPQLRDRICFRPHELGAERMEPLQLAGTMAHFVYALTNTPDRLVF